MNFTSGSHALMTGLVTGALMAKLEDRYSVEVLADPSGDYVPEIRLRSKTTTLRRWTVTVAEEVYEDGEWR